MSLVATPSIKEGLTLATDSSGRVVTPNGSDSSRGSWIQFLNIASRGTEEPTVEFHVMLGISLLL